MNLPTKLKSKIRDLIQNLIKFHTCNFPDTFPHTHRKRNNISPVFKIHIKIYSFDIRPNKCAHRTYALTNDLTPISKDEIFYGYFDFKNTTRKKKTSACTQAKTNESLFAKVRFMRGKFAPLKHVYISFTTQFAQNQNWADFPTIRTCIEARSWEKLNFIHGKKYMKMMCILLVGGDIKLTLKNEICSLG